MSISRRGLLGGLSLLVAAPAVVRASSLMPVRALKPIGRYVGGTIVADFVKDFGGVGDGATDNTAALARAIKWSKSVNYPFGGMIKLPAGGIFVCRDSRTPSALVFAGDWIPSDLVFGSVAT